MPIHMGPFRAILGGNEVRAFRRFLSHQDAAVGSAERSTRIDFPWQRQALYKNRAVWENHDSPGNTSLSQVFGTL